METNKRLAIAIETLIERFQLKREFVHQFMRSQFMYLDRYEQEIQFEADHGDSQTLILRIEEELLKSLDFINLFTAYPFLIDIERGNLESIKTTERLIDFVERVLKSMMTYEKVLEQEKTDKKKASYRMGKVLPDSLDEDPREGEISDDPDSTF